MKIKKEKTLVNKFIVKNIILLTVIFLIGSVIVFLFSQIIHNNYQERLLNDVHNKIVSADVEEQIKKYEDANIKVETVFFQGQEKGIKIIIRDNKGKFIFKTDNVKRKGQKKQVDFDLYTVEPSLEYSQVAGINVLQMRYKIEGQNEYYVTEMINSDLEGTNIPYMNKIFIGLLLIYSFISILIVTLNLMKIKKSIIELKGVTEKISKKDFSVEKVETDCKEINELAENIEYMKNEIEMYLDVAEKYNEYLKEEFDRQVSIDETRKKFINNISHEMRTPLTIVVNCKELLEQIEDEDKRKKYEEVINNELSNLDQLIDGMINVYSEEYTLTERKKEKVNIAKLIVESMERYSILSKRKNVEIIYEKRDCWIDVNLFDFNLVVNNLLMNAYKYVEKNGKIIIHIKENDNSIKINIYNDAEPIDENQIDKIWDKFYRGTGVYGKGTGLGLYLVKNTVDIMQGECGVENIGNGVEFWFEIPK